jgi:hypothetical protein
MSQIKTEIPIKKPTEAPINASKKAAAQKAFLEKLEKTEIMSVPVRVSRSLTILSMRANGDLGCLCDEPNSLRARKILNQTEPV